MRTHIPLVLISTIVFMYGMAPASAQTPRPAAHLPIISASDLRFAVEVAALTSTVSATADQWGWDEFPESNTGLSRGLATATGDLATPLFFGSALTGAWLAGRIWNRPGLSRSALRVTESVAAAGAVSGVLKYTIGRARPRQSPGDPDHFRPFSGNSSFPSGHATVAFALATAIDHETGARWVPFVAYPIAGLVGWSRVRDNRHWLSDVVGGALIGSWVSHRFLGFGGPTGAEHSAGTIVIEPITGGAGVGFRKTF